MVRTWFTLFFIPLIPYRTEYIIGCPICRDSLYVTKAEFEEILSGAKYDTQWKVYSGSTPVKVVDRFEGKTETQISYLKQMEEYNKNK